MGIIILIVLVLLVMGTLPTYGYSLSSWRSACKWPRFIAGTARPSSSSPDRFPGDSRIARSDVVQPRPVTVINPTTRIESSPSPGKTTSPAG